MFAPPLSYVEAPPELAGLAFPAGRLGALGVTARGVVTYLALDDQAWSGSTVEVTLLQANPEPRWPIEASFMLWRQRFDCSVRTITYLGMRTFDSTGHPDGWNLFEDPKAVAIQENGRTPDTEALAAACTHRVPSIVTQGWGPAMKIASGLPRG